jgi:intracellular sulfur oxidation DsrE/DsrF family protein
MYLQNLFADKLESKVVEFRVCRNSIVRMEAINQFDLEHFAFCAFA